MTNIKVSIIIPIYNVEKYITQCVDSVIEQTLNDIEIILVDDGSPDNCPTICDEYAKNDNRIKVIHKQNGGYASAINAGIANASGEYIGIIESDDWVEKFMYEDLYNKSIETQADIIKGNYYIVKNSKKYSMDIAYWLVLLEQKFNGCNFKFEDCPELLKHHTSIWSCIYKRSWLIKNNIRFKEDIRPYEDLPFIAEAYSKAESINIFPRPLYFYRKDATNSSMNKVSETILNYPIQRARAREIYIENNIFNNEFVENFYKVTFSTNKRFFIRCQKLYGNRYYDLMSSLYKNAEADGLKFINFNSKDKQEFKIIAKYSYKLYCCLSMLLKIKNYLYSCDTNGKYKIINFFNMKFKIKCGK